MNKNRTVQPLSENTRKAIIIAAIVAVAVIILSIALALILKPTALSPDDESSSSSGSSSLSIRNGDFQYTTSEDTAFPKTAQNWTRYGYKKADSSTQHDFESISNNENTLMGIVNVSDDDDENWNDVAKDLADQGFDNVTNPKLHKNEDEEEEDGDGNNNVYMIAAKNSTTASILSDSASVSSGASVKISIWLNIAQLSDDSEAVIMVQKSTVSAVAKNWYAYDFHISKQSDNYNPDENGWQKFDFYIFNRDASTKYIRVSIGIGNVYSGEEGLDLENNEPITGSGIIFIDDITYETVNANEYRKQVDESPEDSTLFKVIENEDIVDKSEYLTLKSENSEYSLDTFETSELYVEEAGVSPFTKRDDFKDGNNFAIYKLHNEASDITKPLAMRLDTTISVQSSLYLKDHHHISFWVRVNQVNKVAYANVFVQKKAADGSWEDVDSSSWEVIETNQDVEEDKNCGWVKYDIYLKPSATQQDISILFVLGKNEDYTAEENRLGLVPNGDLYVTSPAYEKIAYNDYNSASSGSYVKKIDLVGTSASTTITNGSFSSLGSTGNQPASWTPAFGGDNSIFKDGNGNMAADLDRNATTIANSGTVQNFNEPVAHPDDKTLVLDDEQQNVLRIDNAVATSFGYFSSDFTLSAKSAYVISVMFKAENKTPYIYLINSNTETDLTDAAEARDSRIIASVTDTNQKFDKDSTVAELFGYDYNTFENGWVRYYMVVVTGSESLSVRLALFNGSLDGAKTQDGTVYYDKVEMRTLGTYSLVKDEDAEEGSEEAKYYNVEWTDYNYTEESDEYGANFGELLEKDLLTEWNIKVHQPTEQEWLDLRLIPDEDETTDNDTTDTDTKEPREIDWGLMFSVISSIALVAALLVVFVIRVYRNKGKFTKAA